MKKKAVFLFLVLIIMFSASRADRATRFFGALSHTKGKFHGLPFGLLPWEAQIIRDVYGTIKLDGARQYKYIYIEIPKKNGKTEFAAGAALYHTFADGEKNGEIYGCAVDKDQASLVFDVAVEMIDLAPALKKRAKLNLSTRKITDRVSGSVYKVVSSEAYSKHGLNISACIFDELHAQPNRDLWDVMTFGAGDARRQPIWIILTTAGNDPDRVSIGWENHDYAMRILSGEISDPTWYPVIFGYQGDDIYNESNWYEANPSLDHTISIESLREVAEKSRINGGVELLFRWLRLNQWVTTKLTTWLPLDLFDKTIGKWDRSELFDLDCYIGMDLSSTTDLSALAFIFPPQKRISEWRVFWEPFIPRERMTQRIREDKVPYDLWEAQGWLTVTDGDVIDYTLIRDHIIESAKYYNIIEVDSDRAMAGMLLQELEQAGLLCVDIPQTYATMTTPINELETLLKKAKLTHEPNPVARWSFGNASTAQNGNEQKKFVKEMRGKRPIQTKRIDPIVAWVNGMARAIYYSGPVDLSDSILSEEWGL